MGRVARKPLFDVVLSWQHFDPDVPQLWDFFLEGRHLAVKAFPSCAHLEHADGEAALLAPSSLLIQHTSSPNRHPEMVLLAP